MEDEIGRVEMGKKKVEKVLVLLLLEMEELGGR